MASIEARPDGSYRITNSYFPAICRIRNKVCKLCPDVHSTSAQLVGGGPQSPKIPPPLVSAHRLACLTYAVTYHPFRNSISCSSLSNTTEHFSQSPVFGIDSSYLKINGFLLGTLLINDRIEYDYNDPYINWD